MYFSKDTFSKGLILKIVPKLEIGKSQLGIVAKVNEVQKVNSKSVR